MMAERSPIIDAIEDAQRPLVTSDSEMRARDVSAHACRQHGHVLRHTMQRVPARVELPEMPIDANDVFTAAEICTTPSSISESVPSSCTSCATASACDAETRRLAAIAKRGRATSPCGERSSQMLPAGRMPASSAAPAAPETLDSMPSYPPDPGPESRSAANSIGASANVASHSEHSACGCLATDQDTKPENQRTTSTRFCICRQPYDARRNGIMVACDNPTCAYGWFHISCLFLDVSRVRASKTFICRFCSGTGTDRFTPVQRPKRPRSQHGRPAVTDYARLHEGDIGGALLGGTCAGALSEAARAAAERRAQSWAKDATSDAGGLAAHLGILVYGTGGELQRMPDAPCVVLDPDGLDMHIPHRAYHPEEVGREYGLERHCEVLDVASQSELHPRWSLGQYLDYLATAPALRQRVLNLISLEISRTPTGRAFVVPALIRRADWASLYPEPRPHVDKYYLLSGAGSWTSWHIDFGGSTVFYHVLRGKKRFYVSPPTERHLQLYERWQRDPQQALRELDFVEELSPIAVIDLDAGNTLFIPAGWLHAVYTPADSVVLGGNILHLGGVVMQHRVFQMENRLRVLPKYQFPLFRELHWLALRQYALALREARTPGAVFQTSAVDSERQHLRWLVKHLRDQLHNALTSAPAESPNPTELHTLLRDRIGLPRRVQLADVQRWLRVLEEALDTAHEHAPESTKAERKRTRRFEKQLLPSPSADALDATPCRSTRIRSEKRV